MNRKATPHSYLRRMEEPKINVSRFLRWLVHKQIDSLSLSLSLLFLFFFVLFFSCFLRAIFGMTTFLEKHIKRSQFVFYCCRTRFQRTRPEKLFITQEEDKTILYLKTDKPLFIVMCSRQHLNGKAWQAFCTHSSHLFNSIYCKKQVTVFFKRASK